MQFFSFSARHIEESRAINTSFGYAGDLVNLKRPIFIYNTIELMGFIIEKIRL